MFVFICDTQASSLNTYYHSHKKYENTIVKIFVWSTGVQNRSCVFNYIATFPFLYTLVIKMYVSAYILLYTNIKVEYSVFM